VLQEAVVSFRQWIIRNFVLQKHQPHNDLPGPADQVKMTMVLLDEPFKGVVAIPVGELADALHEYGVTCSRTCGWTGLAFFQFEDYLRESSESWVRDQ
jgi:hypothetical protein